MFPTQEVNINNLKNDNEKTTIKGKSFLFNFNAGEFVLKDGKPVSIEGLEALKMWIDKILKTEKDKYEIYDPCNYGVSSLKDLLASDYPVPFIKSEIEREVKETLLKNTSIKSVEKFNFERNKRTLKVSFECHTNLGLIESEVNI